MTGPNPEPSCRTKPDRSRSAEANVALPSSVEREVQLPHWLRPMADVAATLHSGLPEPGEDVSPRPAAVLLLFGESNQEPDLLLTERAAGLRRHAGQAAFPGGSIDPADGGPVGAALREAQEETGLDPSGVDVVTTMPPLWIPFSNFVVHPVLAWWRMPSDVRVVDVVEVASVRRVPLAELLDPANRLNVRSPRGHVGPAFRVSGLLIWGFTAIVLTSLFEAAGIDRPWDRSRVDELPEVAAASHEGRGGL